MLYTLCPFDADNNENDFADHLKSRIFAFFLTMVRFCEDSMS